MRAVGRHLSMGSRAAPNNFPYKIAAYNPWPSRANIYAVKVHSAISTATRGPSSLPPFPYTRERDRPRNFGEAIDNYYRLAHSLSAVSRVIVHTKRESLIYIRVYVGVCGRDPSILFSSVFEFPLSL